MMKKLLLLLSFICISAPSIAQDLQLHYDLGKDRNYLTSTIEMFKPDDYGSTFFFIDFDYNYGGNKSISLAYWEFFRYFNLPFIDNKLQLTLQYNDGVGVFDSKYPASLGHILLGGFAYPIDLGFAQFNAELLYRWSYLTKASDVQVSFNWFKPYFDGKLQFTGFMDIWSESREGMDSRFVLLTEPQLWYNVWYHLYLGGEVEISNNFIPGKNDVQINPTLGFKWNF